MFCKILLQLIIVFFVTKFNVCYLTNDKSTVWQSFSDICYFDINRAQQYDNRQSRCQQIPNVIVEKRYFEGITEMCIVLNRNKSIYNISIDDEYKTHNLHMPVALEPRLNKQFNVISIKINRNLFDPNHLLDLDANVTETSLRSTHTTVETVFKTTLIENSLFELFYHKNITCDDIQTSMVQNQYLARDTWTAIKVSFHTKQQVDISHSYNVVYDMNNNSTCNILINISTLNNSSNIAEMIIYQGPFISTASIPSQKKSLEVQSPISVKINGSEACNPFLARVPDPVRDNQPNINPLKFYDKCRELNWVRAEPEPAYCENLPEVNVRSLILNGETKFWCVTVDKNFAPNKYKNDLSPMNIIIQMSSSNNFIRWYNQSNSVNTSLENTFIFEVDHQIVISIEPKVESNGLDKIKSLKVNGVESCGLLLDNVECGERKIKHRPFIAYGLPTYPGQYPWHVPIYEIINHNDTQYLCGGSIIGKNVVLTAAHCVVRNTRVLNPSVLVLEVGRFDLRYATKYTQKYEVIKVIPHEKYQEEYFEHDIAILKSKLYMEFNNFVQPICLTSNDDPFENGIGNIPGWGRNHFNERENILSEASVPIVDNSVCRASNREFFQNFLLEGKFCGGYRNGTTVCSGDSGGGLVIEFPTRWYIKGIVSVGYSKNHLCDLNQFVLFTDVVYYNTWIKSNIIK